MSTNGIIARSTGEATFKGVPKSWKAGVKTSGDTDWVYNSLRFKTKEEAKTYVSDLSARWTAVRETHVEGSDEEPNR